MMIRLMDARTLLGIAILLSTLAFAEDESSEDLLTPDTYYESSVQSMDNDRYKRTPFLTLPGLTWGWPTPITDRNRVRPYEVGKKDTSGSSIVHRRFAFGLGKRVPYDWRYYDDYDEVDPYSEVIKRGSDNRYSFGLGKRYRENKRLPKCKFCFGLGKREVAPEDLDAVQKEEADQHRAKRSIEDDDDDLARINRGAYSFGLGKRRNFNFGLGKRLFEDFEDDQGTYQYPYDQDKRGKSYSFGLGKRNNKPYSFGLGKRDYDEEEDVEEAKRARPYGFGLGKRDRNTKGYNFGLGKRGKSYSFGLGKRDEEDDENAEKRARGNQYSFGLGKRTTEAKEQLQSSSNSNDEHADTSNHHL